LSVDLEPVGGKTQLTFVHRLAEPFDATSVGPGWQYYLDRLAAHLEGTELPSNWDLYSPLGSKYPLPE
jgi:hypothetical protein